MFLNLRFINQTRTIRDALFADIEAGFVSLPVITSNRITIEWFIRDALNEPVTFSSFDIELSRDAEGIFTGGFSFAKGSERNCSFIGEEFPKRYTVRQTAQNGIGPFDFIFEFSPRGYFVTTNDTLSGGTNVRFVVVKRVGPRNAFSS